MVNFNLIANSWDRFLGKQPRKISLDCLPNDILLDCIMSLLDVVDIIRLRQTSKLYYELTHRAALWKRILRTIDIALPPVPPTSRHTPDRMTGLEAERLVCRAISLHMNWERDYPRCLRAWRFDAFHRVLEMTLLPGGRYLVACVSDVSGRRHALVVYAIDTFGRSRPIAKTEIATKAYDICAKYVTIKGQKSIAIAYLRRDYHHKTDKRKAARGHLLDVSQYSTYHDIDPVIEFRYECVAIHARLASLEALADLSYDLDNAQFLREASQLPPPFENLVCVRSSPQHRLLCPNIEEIFDSAYLAVGKCPNDIIFKRLDGGPAATLTCLPVPDYAQSDHTIRAMRLIPQESAAFVVREIDVPRSSEQPCPVYAFEKYTVIPGGPNKVNLVRMSDRCVVATDIGILTHVHIADPHVPPRDDDSIIGKILRDAAEPPPPPPLCVYGRRVEEEGFILARFFPQRIVIELPPTPPTAWRPRGRGSPPPQRREVMYHYPLDCNDLFEKNAQMNENVRVVPGVVRPLMFYTPWEDISETPPILEIRPWIDRGMHYPFVDDGRGFLCPEKGKRRLAAFANAPWEGQHASAIAWDETIGRLVIAQSDTDELFVYEFAHAPRQDYAERRLPLPLQTRPDPDKFHRTGDRLLDLTDSKSRA